MKISLKKSFYSCTTLFTINGFDILLEFLNNKDSESVECKMIILEIFEINLNYSEILNYILIKNSNFIISLVKIDEEKLKDKIQKILKNLIKNSKEGKYLNEIIFENIGINI
jgi:hypothetical protein